MKRILGITMTITAMLFAVVTAQAQTTWTCTWTVGTGAAGITNWSYPAIWVGGVVPGSAAGDTIVFSSGGNNAFITNNYAQVTLGAMSFLARPGKNYTMQTSPGNYGFTFNNSGSGAWLANAATETSGKQTINNPVVLADNLFVTNNALTTGGITLGGNITESGGSRSVTIYNNVTNTGGVTLNGTNSTYSGGTILASGILTVAPAIGTNSLGVITSIGSGPLSISNGSVAYIKTITGTNTPNTITNSIVNNGLIGFTGNSQLGGGIGSISGSGALDTAANTVVLSSANTYSGNTTNRGTLRLTVQGALANSTLVMAGGTNVLSNSTAFTLGGLAAANAGAGYDIALTNASGAAVALTIGGNGSANTYAGNLTDGGLGGSLNVVGGSLSLSGNSTYTGATTVSAGELAGVMGGSCSNSIVTVSADATNGVQVATTGGQWACGGLTYNSGTTYADFNFVNSPSSTTAPLQVNGNLALNGTLRVIVRGNATFSAGTYPLIKYTGNLSGTPPTTAFALPTGMNATIVINTGNKSVDLNITSVSQIHWAVGNGNWDINTTANWKNSVGTTVNYLEGSSVLLDDTASGVSPILVNITTTVNPASVTANLTNKNYTLSGSAINNGAALTKNGSGTLTLLNTNTYNGGTTINAGTLQFGDGVANDGVVAGNIANNGALVFANPDPQNYGGSISGSGTMTQSGAGTVTLSGANSYNGNMTISAGTVTIGGAGQLGGGTYSGSITNDGAFSCNSSAAQTFSGNISGYGTLTQSGPGALTLTNANTYYGGTTLSAGLLNLNYGGASSADSAIGAGPLTISGGTLGNTSGGAVTLQPAIAQNWNGSFSSTNALDLGTGAVTVNTDTTLTVGSNSTLTVGGTIADAGGNLTKAGAGTLNLTGGSSGVSSLINNKQFNVSAGALNVSGYLNVLGASSRFFISGGTINWSGIGTNTGGFTGIGNSGTGNSTLNIIGGTFISSPSLSTYLSNGNANTNVPVASVNVSGGTLLVTKNAIYLGSGQQNAGAGSGILTVTNTGYLDTANSTGLFQLANNGGVGTVNLDGGTLATLRSFTPGTNVANPGTSTFNFNGGTLLARGNNTNIISGLTTANVRNGGVLIDSGGFAVNIAQPLVHSTIGGDNATDGGLTKNGNGTLYLDGVNTYDGPTVVTAGALGGTGVIPSSVTVSNGAALAPGNSGIPGTLILNGDLNLHGNLQIDVNTSLPQSNDVVVVSGGLTNGGTGTLTVNNLGLTLIAGQKFTLFNKAVVNGGALTIVSSGVTWTNELAVDGSIQVLVVSGGAPPNFPPGGITMLPGGGISLTITGAVGTPYRLWATTNLSLAPVTNTWTLLTNSTITVSPFSINDPTATNFPGRFYLFSTP